MPQTPGIEQYLASAGPGATVTSQGTVTSPSLRRNVNQLGFTQRLPRGAEAAEVQLASQRQVAEYRDYLARQAFEVQRQGAETFSAYRPGGAAALTSGMYGGMAQALLSARDIQAPDLMFRYEQEQARQQQQQQEKRSRFGSIGSALGAVAGTLIAPGVGTAIGGALGGAVSSFFARGGIVLPQPGGVQGQTPGGNKATFAEAGQPEVVVPLDKMGEVTEAYEAAQHGSTQGQPPQGGRGSTDGAPQQMASGMPGPGSPPPLGRESPSQQRAGQPADEIAAQQAGVPQMGANAGFIGEAFQRQPGDPGADAYSTVGAAHFASQRLGVPADVINAMLTADEMQTAPGRPSYAAQANARLDYLFDMDEMQSVGIL